MLNIFAMLSLAILAIFSPQKIMDMPYSEFEWNFEHFQIADLCEEMSFLIYSYI